MKKVILLVLMVLVACNSEEEEPMLTKEKPHEEMVIEEIKNQPVKKENMEVEFTLANEIITLNTENIPILEAYLKTVQNKDKTISKMELTTLGPEKLYLLSFNCEKTICSYLLLDRNKPNKSYLIDDLVTIKHTLASPDQRKLLIILTTNDTDQFQVFDLKEWRLIDFQPNIAENKDIQITMSNWKDPTTIEMTYTNLLENTEHTVELKEISENRFK